MTLLEIMAEAYEQERTLWGVRDKHPPKQHEVVRTDPDENFIFISDRFDNLVDARAAFERTRARCSMAAALRALAERDLPEEMIDLGWEDSHGTPDFERDFTTLLREIANEKAGKRDE